MKVTLNLDERFVAMIKQIFDGNLSKGANTLLERQLEQIKTEALGFGLLKSQGPALRRELRKLRKEDQLD